MDGSIPNGTVIDDRWQVSGVLGEGGFGCVYQVEDVSELGLGSAALKVLHPDTSPLERDSFLREVQKIATLRHQNLVGYLDSGLFQLSEAEVPELAGQIRPYLVTELCWGSLADHIDASPGARLAPAEVLAVLGDISDGLAHLHERGLIHRDTKPANVLSADGGWKLADFGLMRDLSASGTYHRGELLIGSPIYMAPELFSTMMATVPSDIYAVGVLIHMIATGRALHAGVGSALAHNITTVAPSIEPSLDPVLRQLVIRMTAADPAQRPTAAHLHEWALSPTPPSGFTPPLLASAAPSVDRPELDDRVVPSRSGGRRFVLLGVMLVSLLVAGAMVVAAQAVDEQGELGDEIAPSSETAATQAAVSTPAVGTDATPVAAPIAGSGVDSAVVDMESHLANSLCSGGGPVNQVRVVNGHDEPVDYRVGVDHFNDAGALIGESFDTIRALPPGGEARLGLKSGEDGATSCEVGSIEVTPTDPAALVARSQATLVSCDLDEFFGNWFDIVFTVTNDRDHPVDADVAFAILDEGGARIDDSFTHSIFDIEPGQTVQESGSEVFWNIDEVSEGIGECIITWVSLESS